MNYNEEEITKAAFKIGLSKTITKSLLDALPLKRSQQQNKAIHVLFQNISFELNRLGQEFTYRGVKGFDIQTTYTPEIVKEFLWKPLEKALLDKTSTTELTSNDIQLIFDILGKWFAEKGVEIQFPSIETLYNKLTN